MLALLPALVGLSFLLAVVCTAVVRRVALRAGFVDRPGHRKVHAAPRPLGGGTAIFLALALPMLAGLAVARAEPEDLVRAAASVHASLESPARALAVHVGGIRQQTPLALSVLLAALAMHLLGLWDDRAALGPYVKLALQLSITTGLVVTCDLRALTALDHLGLGRAPSVVVTVLWIAAITNAFNFLDNMDGLSAGVAAVCTLAFLLTAASIGQWFVASVLALLLGALAGFLVFNFAPASIFMGDAGSLVVGLVLGVLTVRTTFLPAEKGVTLAAGWYAVLAPLVVMAVPLYDLLVVSAIRIARGKSPFVGDTNHLSHRLVARGMSRRTAVLCIWLMTAATSAAAVLLPHVRSTFAAGVLLAQTLMVLGLVMILELHPLPQGAGDDGGGQERRR